MPLQFATLGDRPDLVPQVAGWWCQAFGLPDRHTSFEDYVQELTGSGHRDELPIHLVALSGETPVGAATLKDRSSLQEQFPGWRYWLGGMYVTPDWRGSGIATALCRKVIEISAARGIEQVYLQTEALDGGLYARAGWRPIQRLRLDVEVLVMVRDIPQAGSAHRECLPLRDLRTGLRAQPAPDAPAAAAPGSRVSGDRTAGASESRRRTGRRPARRR
jgi:predicted N-acetyltransferase YhbS